MRLTELEPQFLRYEKTPEGHHHVYVDRIEEAQGLKFLCPKCSVLGGDGVRRGHIIICWAPEIPQTVNPKPGRWRLVGTGYGDLSLVAGSSSIQLPPPCSWHGYVTAGEVRPA